MKSYLNKTFVIEDPDARVRQDDDLLAFVMENGKAKVIPKNTEISVTDARPVNDQVFVSADGWGWTAGNNLKNKFLNETLATFEPADADQKGANAAWDNGHFIKQLTLIHRKDVTFVYVIPFGNKDQALKLAQSKYAFETFFDDHSTLSRSLQIYQVPIKIFLEDGIIKKTWLDATVDFQGQAEFKDWLTSL